MAVTYGFFDSLNGDRKYNAQQMSEFYNGIVNNGVFQHVGSGMAVSAGTGMNVSVAAGRAIIQNHWVKNDAALTVAVPAASSTYARIDAVVIRYSTTNRSIVITIKEGTAAASPSAPSLTRNDTTYEMALAYVNVAANASSVTVTDKRSDTTLCGWVSVAQATSGEVDAQLNAMKTGFDGVVYSSPAAMVQGNDAALSATILNYAKNIPNDEERLRRFSELKHTFIPFQLGNKNATGFENDSRRMAIPDNLIVCGKEVTIKTRPGYSFATYNGKDHNLTGGWVTSYTTQTGLLAYSITVRKDNDADLTDVYQALTPYDVFELDDYSIFASTTEYNETVVSAIYSENPTNMKALTMDIVNGVYCFWLNPGGEYAGKRLTNLKEGKLGHFIHAGDTVKFQIADGYKFAYQWLKPDYSNLFATESIWAYHTADMEDVAPVDCFCAMMLAANDGSDLSVDDADKLTMTIIPKAVKEIVERSAVPSVKPWIDKNATFMGDSITAGVGTTSGNIYWELLEDLCGFNATGMGVGGSCYSTTSDYGSQNSPIVTRYQNIPTSDLICLFAGTNDWGHDTPLGTIADTTDVSFYGALNVVISGILAAQPSARLVLMTPLHRYGFGTYSDDMTNNGAGHTLGDYVQAIKDVCKKYGVPVIDTYSMAGLCPRITAIKNAYVPDGLHPNSDGHHFIASRTAALFNSLQ